MPELGAQPGDHRVVKQTWGAFTGTGLAVDAMTDRSADAHHNSVTRIFPRPGETATTAHILAQLDAG